jgi:hypothetical protein
MVTSVTSPATASRRLNASPLQRISEVVLIGGTVGAAAAASGPLWVVRLGVAAAIAAALMACAFAWRERTRNASVVDILRLRISDARKVIERQRLRIAGQRLQIAELKADQDYLKGEIAHRDEVIKALREAVREQEPELIAQSDDAEVHHMPRRVFVAQDFVWQELSAEDEINDEALEALIDPKIISMVLPNYEADRQPA